MKTMIILKEIHVTMKSFAPPFSTIEKNSVKKSSVKKGVL